MSLFSSLQILTEGFFLQLLLILILTAMIGFIAKKGIARLKAIQDCPQWLKAFLDAFTAPAPWIIWTYGFLTATAILFERIDYALFSSDWVERARNILIIGLATWGVIIWKKKFEKFLKKRAAKRVSRVNDEALIFAIGKMTTVLIVTISGMIILDIMEVQLTAIVAFGGIGGLSIGWAGKDVVVNFFGGLMLHITRPFAVNEAIKATNKNIEGIVEDIGWYLTKLRNFSRQPTYVPNAQFLDAIIENLGRMYNRRLLFNVGVRYQDVKKVQVIVDEIIEMLKKNPEIDQEQLLMANLVNFGAYSLDIEVYCFTKTINRKEARKVQHDMMLDIVAIIESHGAEIAFPTNTIHLQKEEQAEERKLPPAAAFTAN